MSSPIVHWGHSCFLFIELKIKEQEFHQTIPLNQYFKLTTYGLLGKVFDVNVLVCSQFLQHRLYLSLQRAGKRQTTNQEFLKGVSFGHFQKGNTKEMYRKTYLLSRTGPIFCRDLATLKRTLATWSLDIFRTTGSMCLVVISWPHASDRAWIRHTLVLA